MEDEVKLYLNYQLRGNIERGMGDFVSYWVGVYPSEWTYETERLFTEITKMNGSAIAVRYGSRLDDGQAAKDLERVTFAKAKARILAGLFTVGQDYKEEISSRPEQKKEKTVDNNHITLNLLKSLYNIRKENPLEYKDLAIEVEGFCHILGIVENEYLLAVSRALESGFIQEPRVIGRGGVKKGFMYITNVGIERVETLERSHTISTSSEKPITPKGTGYKYDVAISFAGEDRTVAVEIATALRQKNVKVFYDDFEKADLWGKDLYEHFAKVYSEEARFCIMIISHHYASKVWTTHERRSAQARAMKDKNVYILPIRLDDAEIPGLLGTVGYVSIADTTVTQIVDMVVKKLYAS